MIDFKGYKEMSEVPPFKSSLLSSLGPPKNPELLVPPCQSLNITYDPLKQS